MFKFLHCILLVRVLLFCKLAVLFFPFLCAQEKILLNPMYEVPGSNIKRITVSADAVKGMYVWVKRKRGGGMRAEVHA